MKPMPKPFIKHVLKDKENQIVYDVLAFRKLSKAEIQSAVDQYLLHRDRTPDPGAYITIVTTIGEGE